MTPLLHIGKTPLTLRTCWPLLGLGVAAVAGCAPGPTNGTHVATPAERAGWPSEAELTRLQASRRDFNMGFPPGGDIPILLSPAARDIDCRTVQRSPVQLRCSYTLAPAGWIGDNPPTTQVRDLIGRDASGNWIVLAFDVE